MALLASLAALTAATNTTHRRIFDSRDSERLIGTPDARRRWTDVSLLSHDLFYFSLNADGCSHYLAGDLFPGWQGEMPRLKSDSAPVPKKLVRYGPPTLGDKYHEEDVKRGTWVEIISWRPRAFIIHNFLSDEEADQLIEIAKPMMTRSTVVDSVTGESKVDEIRTRCPAHPGDRAASLSRTKGPSRSVLVRSETPRHRRPARAPHRRPTAAPRHSSTGTSFPS